MLLLQKLENQLHVELESADLTTYLVCAQHLLQVGTLCESDSVMSVTPAVSFMLVDVLSACRTCGHHVPAPGRLTLQIVFVALPEIVFLTMAARYLCHRRKLHFGIAVFARNYVI